MISAIDIDLAGVQSLQKYFAGFPAASKLAARDTVNRTTAFAYAEASRTIRAQLNFAQDYIGSYARGNRLTVTRKATNDSPESTISARQRPVSLARYATSRDVFGKAGVRVKVKGTRGGSKFLKSAFLVKLKRGKAPIEDGYNIGLVVRMPKGVPLSNKYSIRGTQYSKKDPDLYLLHGPSVDQAFNTVRDDVSPTVLNYMTREFLRNFQRYNISG